MIHPRISAGLLSLLLVSACSSDAPTPTPLETDGVAAFARGGNSGATPAGENQLVADARASTARYHRIEVALADGYELGSPCVSSPLGGMGYHYVKGALIDDVYDPARPEALLYEPMPNGKLRLVAVEYLSTGDAAPDSRVEGEFTLTHIPGVPWKWEMHAWIWRNNPAGMFEPFNPNVSCE